MDKIADRSIWQWGQNSGMQRCYFIPFGACAINCLLNCAFRRSPANNADGCVLVAVAFWLGQFFRCCIELAETLLHHGCMVFWFIVRMTMFVVFQTGCDISCCSSSRCADRRDSACCVGIALIAMCTGPRANRNLTIFAGTIRTVTAIAS